MDEHFRKRRETLTQDNGLCRSREIRNLLTSWQCEPRYDDNRPSQWVRGVPSITLARSCEHGQARGLLSYTIAAKTKSERIPKRS